MEREAARQYIKRNWRGIIPNLLEPARSRANGETSYICPFCGHGSNGDGLTFDPKRKDGNSLHCFGCSFYGDIIDLYERMNNTDHNTAFDALARMLDITIDKAPRTAAERAARDFAQDGSTTPPAPAETQHSAKYGEQEATADYRQYYHECRERLKQSPEAISYLQARGISLETAVSHWIGYDPAADPAQSGHPTPRIIIPTCSSQYIGRAIYDTQIDKRYRKMNSKGGSAAIFNEAALYAQDAQDVFVTEGAFDALSIIEAGAAAIALNSTSNVGKLLDILKERGTRATLILCLDNDKAGKEAKAKLYDGLKQLDIGCVTADICCGRKDPNEAIQADRDAFIKAVSEAVQQVNVKKPDNTQFYIDQIMTGDIARFKDVKHTGFINLDNETGGIYSGLYAVTAISSLGKTTFCHQLADQLAAAGNDVLFFSLEQSRLELVSKSIARRTAQDDLRNAVTSLAIRRGHLPQNVLKAAEEYKEAVQDRVSIVEGNMACSVSFIGEYTRNYIAKNNVRPVVFIDYLQILQPEADTKRQSTKEIIDSSVTELKRLSRELDITIFVICSINRANYLTPVSMESIKESGGIEYTCDAIWGLQLQCLNRKEFDTAGANIKERREIISAAKAETPRKIELKSLKNRYGRAEFSCYFNYYPANDLFTVCEDDEIEVAAYTPLKAGKTMTKAKH